MSTEPEIEETALEAAIQEQLYPFPPPLPEMQTLVERPDGNTELVIHGAAVDPVAAIAYMHPEIAQAAEKHGIDLKQPPGRELEQMRKFFGQGSGLYLVTVDFQIARTEAFKLDERAQKKIHKALKPKRKKRRTTKKKVSRVSKGRRSSSRVRR